MARFNDISITADIFRVSPRTVENWHSRAYITGFDDGSGTLLYDRDEIERELARRPRTQMRDGRHRGRGKIVALPIEAVSE